MYCYEDLISNDENKINLLNKKNSLTFYKNVKINNSNEYLKNIYNKYSFKININKVEIKDIKKKDDWFVLFLSMMEEIILLNVERGQTGNEWENGKWVGKKSKGWYGLNCDKLLRVLWEKQREKIFYG